LTGVKPLMRLLRVSDLRAAGQHIERHAHESGRGPDIVFAPFLDLDRHAYEDAREETWRRATDAPGWERCFGAFEGERIIGHVDLTGCGLYSALHRARLGIGVERGYRGQGLGSALLVLALNWARDERNLSWIDLSVFAHNERALRLYERHGFKHIGRTVDAYRLADTSIDDVHMTLDLRGGESVEL
jgi:RimJ/RimL family protein N-acetyltransferase